MQTTPLTLIYCIRRYIYTLLENYPFWSPVSSASLPCSQSAVGWRHSWHWFSEIKVSHTWQCKRSAKPNNTEKLNSKKTHSWVSPTKFFKWYATTQSSSKMLAKKLAIILIQKRFYIHCNFTGVTITEKSCSALFYHRMVSATVSSIITALKLIGTYARHCHRGKWMY